MISKKQTRDAIEERFLIQLFDAVDVDDDVEVAMVDNLRLEKEKSKVQTVEIGRNRIWVTAV